MSCVMNTKKSLLLSETTETGIDSFIFDVVTIVLLRDFSFCLLLNVLLASLNDYALVGS